MGMSAAKATEQTATPVPRQQAGKQLPCAGIRRRAAVDPGAQEPLTGRAITGRLADRPFRLPGGLRR